MNQLSAEAVNSRFWKPFFYWLRWRHPWIVGGTIHGWWAQVPARIKWPIARIKWHRARYAQWWVTSSWRALEPVTPGCNKPWRHNHNVTMVTIHSARSAHMIVLVRTWLLSLPILTLRVSKIHNSMVKVLSFFVLNPLFKSLKYIELSMTDIKQIYTSHQSLVGTVTPSVIRTVPFSLGGYAPSGKWYSPYNFGCSNQRLALACIFVY